MSSNGHPANIEPAFYETYGRTILSWQYVENSLYLIYSDLIRGEKFERVSAAYHEVTSFNTHANMVNAAMQYAFMSADKEMIEWKRLRGALRTESQKRNSLAHYGIEYDIVSGEVKGMRLVKSMLNLAKKPIRTYDLKSLEAMRLSFLDLAKELSMFREKIAKFL